ncbi:MAG: protein-L-isoaspartate O-methyltransferase [Burkholderiales bacterium]|nr:protein-L-isoaspartate O-methyltransferase [Burkholderiales bacterium]MCE7877572.1 protein-L-isoaspartate O-methyltransferase [Betaproteobacteria bacterium PRO3]
MDVEQARFNMVEQQIRPWEVLDPAVLDLLFTVRREEFVPSAYRALAFADLEIPIGEGESMWAPKLEARALQELAPRRGETVLEIGTGSGYLTALIASLAGHVTSVEIHGRFSREAAGRLRRAAIDNVELVVGDGSRGFGNDSYDAILLSGSTPILHEAFFRQLKPGGRVFAIVGDAPAMTAKLFRFSAPGACAVTSLFETVVKPLVNAPAPARFAF